MKIPTEMPPATEIDWAAETAVDEAAANAIKAELLKIGLPEDRVNELRVALDNPSNRVLLIEPYRVVRGVGHVLMITKFTGGREEIVFTTGQTHLDGEPAIDHDEETRQAA